jgi:23S rRNA pseudouridine1911/1915/1917 synthase
MNLNIIYEDNDILVVDKPSGIVVFNENKFINRSLIDYLIEKYPQLLAVGNYPRYGIIHRLDKETSGLILVAKSNKALYFFQKQFKTKSIVKKYVALVIGRLENEEGEIRTLIGRSPNDYRKQRVYLFGEPGYEGKREAITKYKVIKYFSEYTLVEIMPETGRKHQIRCHFAYINHPIAGDKLYGFKNQPLPEGLNRHFLHASYLKVKMLNEETKEFFSTLPQNLETIIKNLK